MVKRAPQSSPAASLPAAARSQEGERRLHILEAALSTFLRFGFRKTSMDEVARAAGLSRQGLYLYYPTKEELFCAALRHALDSSLNAAQQRLRAADLELGARLVAAFSEWTGRYVGLVGADLAELKETSERLVGPLLQDYEAQFSEQVLKTVRGTSLASAYKERGVTARELTDTLLATARGLKYVCANRAEFSERFGVAVRIVCCLV